MKILHITSGSTDSGSFKGTYLLHKYLLNRKIKSKIINNSFFDNQSKLKKTRFINNNLFSNFYMNILFFFDRFPKIFFFSRKATSFSTGFVGYDITKLPEFKNADIIHLHWINKGFFNVADLEKINKPVVWTFRDMWPFTGGCHYSLGCKKFINKCGNCPQLGSNFRFDLSYFVQKKKKKFFNNKIYFVTISEWLTQMAKKSSLLKNFNVKTMNNHIDVDNFYPENKKYAKKNLELPNNKKIILYGAQNIISPYKGFKYFLKSLNYLNKSDYFLILFGSFWNHKDLDEIGIKYKSFGYVKSLKKMRCIYSSADVFAASSIQDAFPKTFAEAMLCGTPVVSFAKGAISSVNIHKKTGYIAKIFDSKDFAKGINHVVKFSNYGKKARKIIIRNFHPKKITNNYVNLYRKILSENK